MEMNNETANKEAIFWESAAQLGIALDAAGF